MTLYRQDLAYIHDVGFGDFARRAAPGLLALAGRGVDEKGLLIDLGCGSGIWAREAIDAGYRVLGIDVSVEMIEIARRRAPKAELRVGSLYEEEIPPCQIVTSLGECLNYFSGVTAASDRLATLFHKVFAALDKGGLFVFDIAEFGKGRAQERRRLTGDAWSVVVDYEEDSKAGLLTRRITTERRLDVATRRDQEVHRLKLYGRVDVADQLRRVGFDVKVLGGYGEMKFPDCHVGFLARKGPA